MSTQPEALRLADCLDEPLYATHKQMTEAADELRRLHDESEMRAAAYSSACGELRKVEAQCDALLEALKDATKTIEHLGYPLAAIERARAAIKAVEEGK